MCSHILTNLDFNSECECLLLILVLAIAPNYSDNQQKHIHIHIISQNIDKIIKLTAPSCLSLSLLQSVKMPHSISSFPTETLISKTSLDFFSTSEASTEPYTENSFTTSNISGLHSLRCTYKEDFKRILLPAVYTFVFLLGLPLNGAVILKIWRTRPNLSKNNIYMINLAIADFLYVMSLPLLIYNYGSHDYWPFGELACKLVRFQFYR